MRALTSRASLNSARPIAAIGGAGTLDGVFLIGILAGLLAAWIAPASREPRARRVALTAIRKDA